jgi:hypothetical protein
MKNEDVVYKRVLYIARNRYIEVPSLHRKVLIISIFCPKNLHMSKKSSTFALEIKNKSSPPTLAAVGLQKLIKFGCKVTKNF